MDFQQTFLQPIPVSPSSCSGLSGLEVVLVDIIPLRISISQFRQPIVLSASMTPVLVSAPQMIYGWGLECFGVEPMPFDGFYLLLVTSWHGGSQFGAGFASRG
jgi:hypothetical protein